MLIDLNQVRRELARRHLFDFSKSFIQELEETPFHSTYYKILDLFALGKIKRLIVSVPPQHGKTEGSTRKLPPFMHGHNKKLNIAIASYNDTMAKKFGRAIKMTMRTKEYQETFDTRIPERVDTGYTNTANEVDIIEGGSLKFIGRGGSLTGSSVDVMIMDDLYKDFAEGNSPVVRESVWDWYTTVVRTRLHNNSQELIVFTRWNEDDLIGRLEQQGKVIEIKSLDDIKNIPDDVFVKVNFEAIKESPKTDLDQRELGEALWPNKHSLTSLIGKRELDPEKFNCLYQGNAESKEGLLYGKFQTYDKKPDFIKIGSYTDTADQGDDYLCSIVYGINDNKAYILDVLYTQDSMEITEPQTARQLDDMKCNLAIIESNNGGRGFARNVQKLVKITPITWFHQSQNKESRILTNAATVTRNIVMPSNWAVLWPEFYKHIKGYKKIFKANKHDDAADTITGVVETMNNYGGEDFLFFAK